jgi:nuclear transport factor 2 (NTF2) superfamily protein
VTRTWQAIKTFLSKKWIKEIDYCLMKELWGFHGNRISARFEYEWHDDQGQWWRSHGNEQWEFDAKGTCVGEGTEEKDCMEKDCVH